MLLTDVKIYVRPLPTIDDTKCIRVLEDSKTIQAKCQQDLSIRFPNNTFYWQFATDGILNNSNQGEVANVILENSVENAVNGYSTIIVGYGQSGSGKSFTINGLYFNYKKRGLGARLISLVLSAKRDLQSKYNIECCVSYCELHGNKIYDLLDVNFKNLVAGNAKINNLSQVIVANEDQGLSLLFEGEGKRLVNKQVQERVSHLGTSVLMIHLTSTVINSSYSAPTVADILIIDLAGVDCIESPIINGKKNYDVGLNNKNMLFFELYLKYITKRNISKKNGSIIGTARRLSPLVNLLADTLNGKCCLRFICHIRSDEKSLPTTLSMLRFIPVVKSIEPELVTPKIKTSPEIEVAILKDKLNELMQNMIRRATFSDDDLDHFICNTRLEHMHRLADDFLEDKVDDLVVFNSAHALTVLNMMKQKYVNIKKENETLLSKVARGSLLTPPSTPVPSIEKGKRVGEVTLNGRSIGPGTVVESDYVIGQYKESDRRVKHERSDVSKSVHSGLVFNQEKAWRKFNQQDKSKTLQNEYEIFRQLQETIVSTYKELTTELYSIRSNWEKAKMALTDAQMQRRLTQVDEYDDNGFIIPTVEETRCIKMIKDIEKMVKNRESKLNVLKQEYLDASLGLSEAKETIDTAFLQFCHMHYKTGVAKPDCIENTKIPFLDHISVNSNNEELLFFQNQYNRQYKKMQKIMYHYSKIRDDYEFARNRRWRRERH